MLYQIKNHPFKSYVTIILILGIYAYSAQQNRNEQAVLYTEIDKLVNELLEKIASECFNTSSFVGSYSNPYNPSSKILNNKAKILSRRLSDLNAAFFDFDADEKEICNTKADRLLYLSKISLERDLLYQTIFEILEDTTLYLDGALVGEKPVFTPFQTIRNDQFLRQGRYIYFQDMRNVCRTLAWLQKEITKKQCWEKENLIPFLSFREGYLSMGDTIMAEFFLQKYYSGSDLVFMMNGETIPIENGIGKFAKIFGTAGIKELEVRAYQGLGGTDYSFSKTFKTLVVQ